MRHWLAARSDRFAHFSRWALEAALPLLLRLPFVAQKYGIGAPNASRGMIVTDGVTN